MNLKGWKRRRIEAQLKALQGGLALPIIARMNGAPDPKDQKRFDEHSAACA